MDILQKAKLARQKLNATQVNWQEACLFDCNDLLKSIIAELESGLTPAAPDAGCPLLRESYGGKRYYRK